MAMTLMGHVTYMGYVEKVVRFVYGQTNKRKKQNKTKQK